MGEEILDGVQRVAQVHEAVGRATVVGGRGEVLLDVLHRPAEVRGQPGGVDVELRGDLRLEPGGALITRAAARRARDVLIGGVGRLAGDRLAALGQQEIGVDLPGRVVDVLPG